MLTSLSIKDVVLIDRLVIELESGLCVLTGETGAGKSILLDSLGLALGVRAESSLVRKGAENANVTASFQIPDKHLAHEILQEAAIEIEDNMLLLRRVVATSGKSRAFINDHPVSIGLLKRIGDTLVEIHGQFETQGLLNPATHRSMLDSYAKIDLNKLKTCWDDWKAAEQNLHDLKRKSASAQEERDYIKTSLDDLEKLTPIAGEEEKLAELRERLKHRDALMTGLNAANMALSGDYDPVQKAQSELDKVSGYAGGQFDSALETLNRASSEIAEAHSIIQGLSSDLQESDANLDEVDERLYALRMQARKHKCNVDDLPQIMSELAEHLNIIENVDDALNNCQKACDKTRTAYITAAQKISDNRKKTAEKLNKLVQTELAPLKLEKARFVTDIQPLDEVDWNAQGMDQVWFLVATNPGAQAGPIHKIASGGEMSRFMLALKVIIAQEGSTHSFIFDEVDAGIGGATADAVGERLSRLAQSKQVLVVTHAPQVAARADSHWIVTKSGKENVKTDIKPLEGRSARCEEIARMLAGADITPEARAAADRLLEASAA